MPPTRSLTTADLTRDCADLADTALGTVLLEDVVTDCNATFCRMLGCEPADVIGKTFLDLCPPFQADGAFSQERWQRRWYAARAGLQQWFPWQFSHAAAGRVHGLVHLANGPA